MGGKWKFTEPFIKRKVEETIENRLPINKKEIALAMIKHFDLSLNEETARKIVSRIINKKEKKKMPLPLKNQKEAISGMKLQKFSDLPIAEMERILKKKIEKIDNIKEFSTPGIHIVSGCWHVPFHNKRAIAGLLSLVQDLGDKVVGFHLTGDFLDLNSLSMHERGKRPIIEGLNLTEEYQEGNEVLDQIENSLPLHCQKSYLYGNHEDRYWRYIRDNDNAKVPPISPTDALKLKTRNYSVHEDWANDFITLGAHLDVLHGTYYNVHCAKKHMDVLRGSVMFTHTHRVQTYIEGDTGAFNIGHMANADSKGFSYAPRTMRNSWKNGFALVHIDQEGDYYVEQIILNKNKFYYNGKVY